MSTQTATAVATTTGKDLKPHEAFEQMLHKRQSEFMKALPSHISYDKFQRVVMTAVITEPKLLGADRSSLMVSCLKAAQDGLLPDKRDAALVIFNSKVKDPATGAEKWIDAVQYMPMYSGILKKVRQSDELAGITAHVVYARDTFNYILGDEEKIEHKPYFGAEERGDIVAAYCIARLKDGTVMREVMTFQDIEKIRKKSKSGNDKATGESKGIWKDWYEEMAKKTVFRRLAKWLPQTADILETALKNDDSMQVLDAVKGGEARQTIEGTSKQVPQLVGEDAVENNQRSAVLQQAIDNETGELIDPEAYEPETVTANTPASKSEGKKPGAKKCEECSGFGVTYTEDGKEPCQACAGKGKV